MAPAARPTKLVGPLYSRPIPAVGGIPTIIPTTVISNVPVRKRRKPALPEELPKPPEKT